tara:strand:+ start:562 stop:792 length:231 start_codon:yes stop_codon:yes gene_type:complete
LAGSIIKTSHIFHIAISFFNFLLNFRYLTDNIFNLPPGIVREHIMTKKNRKIGKEKDIKINLSEKREPKLPVQKYS